MEDSLQGRLQLALENWNSLEQFGTRFYRSDQMSQSLRETLAEGHDST